MWIELVKRFAPFTIALMLGLFVASFFVSIKPFVPFRVERRYDYNRNEYRNSCWKYRQQIERENRLRDADLKPSDSDFRFQEGEIDFNSIKPVAPAAPTVPREKR